MKLARVAILSALGATLAAVPALAVEVPPEGQCPPYPLPPERGGPAQDDVVPPLYQPGEVLPLEGMRRLANYLPEEVWERRDVFFYEGMAMELGPCHRRYPAPPFFVEATAANEGVVSLDAGNNLRGYRGSGLPFAPQGIADDAPDAGAKWAWNYTYRYLGSGFRGPFRILNLVRRGRKIDRFKGRFYLLPMQGVPNQERDANGARYWAGGKFTSPAVARGLAWRQLHPAGSDQDAERSDEIWLWTPEERRVRRAPPMGVDGLYLPSYTRGNSGDLSKVTVPGGIETPSSSIAAAEHTRMGFTGMFLRPNQFDWKLVRVQDVIAPLNAPGLGFPANDERSYGASGQSLASDRWEIRRAVVIEGVKKKSDGQVGKVKLWIDVLTQHPLYMVTRRPRGQMFEVGILMGRFSGDDPVHPVWEGSGPRFGTILPVAATFYTGRGSGWLRESFELRSDPPGDKEARDQTSTTRLQRGR